MIFEEKPFKYVVIDNFLSEKEFEEVERIYKAQQYKEKATDLFRFLQSCEINDKLENFLKKLNKDVFSHTDLKLSDMYYTCFANYYRKGDFLLCHDDCIDFREYAFTFYLDDFETGKLALYEDDCLTMAKNVDVKKNRIVVFKVDRTSFHEVQKCMEDGGRRAITGWINSKTRIFEKEEEKRELPTLKDVKLIELCDLSEFLESDNKITEIPLPEFNELFKVTGKKPKGPLVDRKTTELLLDIRHAFEFPGLELIYYEPQQLTEDGYILTNDVINEFTDVIDGFYFITDCENVVNYVEGENVVFTLSAPKETLLLVKRKEENIFVPNDKKDVSFVHFIYTKK